MKEELTIVQWMNEEHQTQQEVEKCATMKAKVKETVNEVKNLYDEFKTKLNAQAVFS